METWKPVVGLEDRYMISNTGRCKRKARSFVNSSGHTVHVKELEMKPTVDEYVEFVLSHPNHKQHCHTAHRMVAEAFLPNPSNFPVVNHKDENKHNNCVENLEWCTYEHNVRYNDNNRRISRKLKNRTPANAIKVQCVETGQVYSSIAECKRRTNIPYNRIKKSLVSGNSVGGFTFVKLPC